MKKRIAVLTSTLLAVNAVGSSVAFADFNTTVYPKQQMLVDPDEFMKVESNWNGPNVVEDRVLRYMINSRYNRVGTEEQLYEMPVTKEMMENLVMLSPEQCKAHNAGEADFMVKDLKGLEYAKNLQWLSLVNQMETSLEPIKECKKLKHLDIRNNDGITDLSPISGLTDLVEIDMRSVKVKNLQDLKNLTNLKTLVAFSCGIEDLSGIENLKSLEYLELEYNPFTNIDKLSELTNLRYLDISKNGKFNYLTGQELPTVSTLSPLTKLVNLENLAFTSNKVSDLKPLEGMTKLKSLFANNNEISDWSVVKALGVEKVTSDGNIKPYENTNPTTPVTKTYYQAMEIVAPTEISGDSKEKVESMLPTDVTVKVKKKTSDYVYENGIYNKATVRYVIQDAEGNKITKKLKFNAIPTDSSQDGKYDIFSENGYVDFTAKDVKKPNEMTLALDSNDYELVGTYKITEETCMSGFYLKSVVKNDAKFTPDDVRPEYKTIFDIPEDKKDIFVITVKEKPQVQEKTNQNIESGKITYVVKDEKGNVIKDNSLVFEVDDEFNPLMSYAVDGYVSFKIDGTSRDRIHIRLKTNPNYELVSRNVYSEDYDSKSTSSGKISYIEKDSKSASIKNDAGVYSLTDEQKEMLVLTVREKASEEEFEANGFNRAPKASTNDGTTVGEPTTQDVSEMKVPVEWRINAQKSDEKAGKLVYDGTLILPETLENPIGLFTKIDVTIKKTTTTDDNNGGTNTDTPEKPGDNGNTGTPEKPSDNGNTETPVNPLSVVKGSNRINTSLELSKKFYKNADTVILVNGYNYPDALVSSALSSKLKAPILLTNGKTLTKETIAELTRLKAKEVLLIGGKGSMNEDIANKVKELKLKSERISGANRYETAGAIMDKLNTLGAGSKNIILASGENYPDALSAGNIASSDSTPILLVKKNAIPQVLKSKVEDSKIGKILVIGGSNSVSNEVLSKYSSKVTRLSGANRYETATKVAEYQYPNAKKVFIASGEQYPDALSAGGVLGISKSPLLLTKKNTLSVTAKAYLKNVKEVVVVGGENSVNPNILK